MKRLIIVIFFLATVGVRGQVTNVQKIRLGIILPDTMLISNDLLEYAREAESEHINDYYRSLEEMEGQLQEWMSWDSLNRFRLTKRAIQRRLDSTKAKELEIKGYKYYYKLADYSVYHFKSKLRGNSEVELLVIGTRSSSKKKFKEITGQFNLEYLLRYSDIDARSADDMKLTATLYSRNLNILLKEHFSANGECPGERMRCVTPFCCMLINITNLSTSRISEVITGLQKE